MWGSGSTYSARARLRLALGDLRLVLNYPQTLHQPATYHHPHTVVDSTMALTPRRTDVVAPLYKMAKAALTGEPPKNLGEHKKVVV